jgi:predicted transposase/invertase (TIGR01784 family)
MRRLLNPRVDFAFKKLFGSEENKAILIAFINAILPESEQMCDVELLNPYNQPARADRKLSILDIKAQDKQGRQYNIEMQLTDQVHYNQRALYYWSKFYSDQLLEGEPFSALHKTISIHILNFNYFDEPEYHHTFRVLNIRTHKCYFEDLELHFIELEKFDTSVEQISTALDRWATFLKRAGAYQADRLPATLGCDQAIVQAMTSLERLNLSDEEYQVYEEQLKWLRDEAGALEKKGLVAYEAGLTQGREEGMEKGMEKKTLIIAQNALREGTDPELVAKITGLTLEQVDAIKSSQ